MFHLCQFQAWKASIYLKNQMKLKLLLLQDGIKGQHSFKLLIVSSSQNVAQLNHLEFVCTIFSSKPKETLLVIVFQPK